MLNTTDKRKIDKIIESKLTEYKEDLKKKTKELVEKKAKEIETNAPQELIDACKELDIMKKAIETKEDETKVKFEHWNINRGYGRDSTHDYSLKRQNDYVYHGRNGTETTTTYDHPEVKKLHDQIERKERAIADAGKAATLELFTGTKEPLAILEAMEAKVIGIINS